MSTINAGTKEVLLKIVYYGPGLCGKTTTLQAIHGSIPEESRPEMVSVATDEDRTLFFDFLPVDAYRLGKYTIRLLMYTVPGQVYYNSTRKLVLNGADGVVFVADSQPQLRTANIESYRNLHENLSDWGIELATFPHVLQFNKRDLPGVMPVEMMNADVNEFGKAAFETVAFKGTGVLAPMKEITRLVLQKLRAEGVGGGASSASAGREKKRTSLPSTEVDAPRAPATAGGADSIEASFAQQQVTPSTTPESAPAPAPSEEPPASESSEPAILSDGAGGFTLASCWTDPVSRAEAAAIEQLIVDGQFSGATLKAAQLVNLLAHRAGHSSDQEALFAMLHGVSGAHYLRFRRLVSRALRGETISESEALSVYVLAAQMAIER